MAVRSVVNYPNGAKLLIFYGGKVKYVPTKAYEEAKKKAQSTFALSKRGNVFKDSSKLVDAIFEDKIPGLREERITKSEFSQGVHKVIEMRNTQKSHSNNYPKAKAVG